MIGSFDPILFDNDGVLVDTEPLFLQATQELLSTIDVRLTAEDYHDISMRQGRIGETSNPPTESSLR